MFDTAPPRARPGFVLALSAALVCAIVPVARAQWQANGVPVVIASGAQDSPAIAADGTGGAIIAWTDRRTPTPRIYAMRLTQAGALHPDWPGGGRPVCTVNSTQGSPVVVADGSGGAIIAWVDQRLEPAGDLYVTRITEQGLTAPGWSDAGTVLCAEPGYKDRPVAVSDGAGGAFFAWQDGRSGVDPTIAITRIGADGAFPPGWSASTPGLTDAGFFPALAADGAGGAIVVWADASQILTTSFDIRAARFRADATRVWGAPKGTVVCDDIADQTFPSVVSDALGAAVVTWVDARNGNSDLYGQRMDTGGLRTWAVAGVPLVNQADEQGPPFAVADGAGGAILAFEDPRDPLALSPEIFGQHVTNTGALAATWTLSGKLVGSGPDAQQPGGMIPDGTGGAILAWTDYRAGGMRDIYALRITGAGGTAAGWTSGGGPVCVAANGQYEVALCGDGAGGAVLVWVDDRGATPDLYAQKVTAGGVVGPVVGVPSSSASTGLALSTPVPQPSRGVVHLTLTLERAGAVDAAVFDAAGRRVCALLAHEMLDSGVHALSWDGRIRPGRPSPAGVYFIVASANGMTARQRTVRLTP